MSTPTAVIAEDEPLLRAEIREALAKLWPELKICAEAADGMQALQALNTHAPQVLFLDIQMPELSGLEVAQQAMGKVPSIMSKSRSPPCASRPRSTASSNGCKPRSLPRTWHRCCAIWSAAAMSI
jgi:CheY-like chemotaxis protein